VIVLDTHVWLWWAGGVPELSKRARAELEQADRIGVCAISCWELAMLVRLGRVELDRDVRTWIAVALRLDRVETLPLEPEIASEAGALDDDLPGDPVDRIVYATARALEAPLLTKDRRLRAYDRQRTLW
jgi:PIN domain nuclease of toxin-antitoxin system